MPISTAGPMTPVRVHRVFRGRRFLRRGLRFFEGLGADRIHPGHVLAGGTSRATCGDRRRDRRIFGYEDGWDNASEPSIVRASVTTELASASVQGEDDLSWIGKRGKVADPSLGRLRDCWCATSIDDRKVPVYRTTSSSHGVAIHNIGGGMKTFDVERFHKGHWQVSWRDNAERSPTAGRLWTGSPAEGLLLLSWRRCGSEPRRRRCR